MATLYVKDPSGTTHSVDLATMNITSSLEQNGWCKLPNGLIIQWGIISATEYSGFNIFSYPVEFVSYTLCALVCERGGRSWINSGGGYFSVHSIDGEYLFNNCAYSVSIDNSQGGFGFNHNAGFCFVLGK